MLISAFGVALHAQENKEGKQNWKEKKEAMKAMKVGHITQKLELTTQEAEKFWPIYNELYEKIEAQRKPIMAMHRKIRKSENGIADLSDGEISDFLRIRIESEEKIAALKKDYNSKFVKVLGEKKTAMLYIAEMDFHREMMRKGKDKK